MKHRVLFVALAATLALSACKKAADTETVADAPAATEAPVAPAPTTEPAAAATPKFDIASVPVSDKPLGAFPYFSLPLGYGQDQPVADNATDEGKARNRRVELVKI